MTGRVRLCTAVLAAGVVLVVPGTAGAAAGKTAVSPNRHIRFGFGGVAQGQSATQVFTFSTGGRRQWSGNVVVQLTGSPDFSVSSDGCTGALITPAAPSCQVGVTFAPSATGSRRSFAVLSVSAAGQAATHLSGPHAGFSSSVLLSGHGTSGGTTGGGGPASLQLSPGTTSDGTNYSYSFGQVSVVAQTFRLTNTGGQASLPLALNGWNAGGFWLFGDTCTGTVLSPGASCTFNEAWQSANDPLCNGVGEPVSLSSTVDSSDGSTTYANVSLSAVCG